ncbi:TPA: hypothetical protein QCY63_005813 [Bacillus cereus]|nr:hypothetical protein [Bacillus cereus]
MLTKLEKEEIMDFVDKKEAAQQLNKYLEDTRENIETLDFPFLTKKAPYKSWFI